MNKELTFNEFINKIAEYEFSLIQRILEIYKMYLINDYFSSNRVEAWYCYNHDQGFLLSSKYNLMITDITTNICCSHNNNYLYDVLSWRNFPCQLEFTHLFDKKFIRDFEKIKISSLDLNFELDYYMKSFYDYKNDRFVETPLPVKLFYDKYKLKY